jgi:hypothetical protein
MPFCSCCGWIPWNALPKELGDDSTAHRRLQEWQADGTFARLWYAFLSTLDKEDKLDWAEAFLDGTLFCPKGRAPKVTTGVKEREARDTW